MDQEIEIRKRRGTRVLLTVLAAWGLAVAAETGVYRAIYPLLLAPIIALGIVVPVAVYAMSKGFRAYIKAIGLQALTAFHIWRIAAALLFFWYGAHDLLPQIFVQNAGWGDLIAGLLALSVTLLPESRNRYADRKGSGSFEKISGRISGRNTLLTPFGKTCTDSDELGIFT